MEPLSFLDSGLRRDASTTIPRVIPPATGFSGSHAVLRSTVISSAHARQIYICGFLARICAGSQPAGNARHSSRRNARGMVDSNSRCCVSALVVDCGGACRFLRPGLDLPLFRGAQPARQFRASALVMVGGPKDGGLVTHREVAGQSGLEGSGSAYLVRFGLPAFLHSRAQLSTGKLSETTCQVKMRSLFSLPD